VWGLELEGGHRGVGRRRGATALAVSAALMLGACGGSGSNASYGTLVAQGVKLLHQGKTDAAFQRFQQAVKRDTTSPVAHYDLGVIYQQRGQIERAKREYGLAIHYDPGYVPALYNEAGLYANTFPPLAIFYYRRIIHIQPNSPTAYLNLGLVEAGRPQLRKRALHDLAAAVKLDPSLRAAVPASLRASLPAPKNP
jgi:tetratricopeptide (TPR) repeat protein